MTAPSNYRGMTYLVPAGLEPTWQVKHHFSSHSLVSWWTVERGRTVDGLEWLLNDAGRIRRFRSEKAAILARDAAIAAEAISAIEDEQ